MPEKSMPQNLRDRIDNALSTFGPIYGKQTGETTKRVGENELVIFKDGQKFRVKVEEIGG